MRRCLGVLGLVGSVLLALASRPAQAHCDTMDGPVVKTAQKALETGKLEPVLAWVRAADEAEVKAAYEKALAVRKLGADAREMADHWSFETLVRVHRAGEGAPYTGLKPAGQVEPALAAADRAIEQGAEADLARPLTDAVKDGLHQRFARLKALAAPAGNVAAGREWVAAYVNLVHYVEGLHNLAAGKAAAHGEDAAHEAHAHGGEAQKPDAPAGHAEPAGREGHGSHEGH